MSHLDSLRAFVRVVELGSFTSVAHEMRVKQSTVSKWIADLEEEFGTNLIERTTRSKRLTESGQIFYDAARQVLSIYDQTAAELGLASTTVAGRLRVSIPVVFGQRYIMKHLGMFGARFPHVELDVQFTDRYVNLIDENVDLAVRVGSPVDSDLVAIQLGKSRRIVVASPEVLAKHPIQRPQDLADVNSLLHSGLNTPTTWEFRDQDGVHRVRVRGRFSANLSEALLELARQGMGFALLAEWLVRDDLQRGDLVPVLEQFEAGDAPIQALVVAGPRHPRVQVFIEFLQEILATSNSS